MNKKLIFVVVALALIGKVIYMLNQQKPLPPPIATSLEECAQVGYPAEESHPRQCRTPEGRHFVKMIDNEIEINERNNSRLVNG